MGRAFLALISVMFGVGCLLSCDTTLSKAKPHPRSTPNDTTVTANANVGTRVGSAANAGSVTFIHTGDFHGDLLPHVNLRADSTGRPEGGLARVYTAISRIRAENPSAIYVHSGDTIGGSAETTFTRGKSIVDVVNKFGVDLFVPGNWEFGFGTARMLEIFGGGQPLAPWGALAANAYYTGAAPFSDQAPGTRLLPPYRVMTVNGIKIGFFACTTNRGPTIISSNITEGVAFSACRGTTINEGLPTQVIVPPEIPFFVDLLRNQEKVDVVAMISELGLAENIWNAEHHGGIDIIFSSDMHEITRTPVSVSTPGGGSTLIIEEGEDGAQVGELTIDVDTGKIAAWHWTAHAIDTRIPEDPVIADLIEDIREPFVAGRDFVPGRFVNPYNGSRLMQPIDTVIGQTEITLDRNAFSNEANPALIEGTGHDFLADAFRATTSAQIGGIRGFRYSGTIPPGPITLEDIYHYIPIGPQIAYAEVRGAQLNRQLENAAASCMDPDVTAWLGGWMFNFSGLTFDLDPYRGGEVKPIEAGRAFNIKLDPDGDGVGDTPITDTDETTYYTYASYFYGADPTMVNRVQIDPEKIGTLRVVVKGPQDTISFVAPDRVTPDNVLDAVDIVARYIGRLPNRTITAQNTPFPRINLSAPLPDTTPVLGFPVIEPVYGMDPARYTVAAAANRSSRATAKQ